MPCLSPPLSFPILSMSSFLESTSICMLQRALMTEYLPHPEPVGLNKEGHDYEEELAVKLSQSYFVLPTSHSDLYVVYYVVIPVMCM
jgi:hypothetical protein